MHALQGCAGEASSSKIEYQELAGSTKLSLCFLISLQRNLKTIDRLLPLQGPQIVQASDCKRILSSAAESQNQDPSSFTSEEFETILFRQTILYQPCDRHRNKNCITRKSTLLLLQKLRRNFTFLLMPSILLITAERDHSVTRVRKSIQFSPCSSRKGFHHLIVLWRMTKVLELSQYFFGSLNCIRCWRFGRPP